MRPKTLYAGKGYKPHCHRFGTAKTMVPKRPPKARKHGGAVSGQRSGQRRVSATGATLIANSAQTARRVSECSTVMSSFFVCVRQSKGPGAESWQYHGPYSLDMPVCLRRCQAIPQISGRGASNPQQTDVLSFSRPAAGPDLRHCAASSHPPPPPDA